MESTTKPPVWRRLAAGCLSALNRTLPRPLYDRIYWSLFPRYQAWQRRRARLRALRRPGADHELVETISHCLQYSLVGWQGMEVTYACVRTALTEGIPGDLVECGVARGGSALLIALASQRFGKGSRQLWLFDSFEGLPDPTADDYRDGKTGTHVRPLPKGSCLGTVEDVRHLLFEEHHLPEANTHLVKGWFQDTLPATAGQLGAIAVLRLDGDWYESTRTCLEALFDKVGAGGFVILDDYYSCFGCKKATDEFLAARGASYPINPDGRGGAYFRKTDQG